MVCFSYFFIFECIVMEFYVFYYTKKTKRKANKQWSKQHATEPKERKTHAIPSSLIVYNIGGSPHMYNISYMNMCLPLTKTTKLVCVFMCWFSCVLYLLLFLCCLIWFAGAVQETIDLLLLLWVRQYKNM